MASIFRRGRDKGKRRSHWYVGYTDHTGKRRTRKGFTDKGLTEQLAAKIDTEVMLRKRGLIDPTDERLAEQKQAPIEGHLQAFERSLGKNTAKHVKLTMARIRKVVDGCGFQTIDDIDAESVEEFLLEAKASEGFGHRTYNHYVQAADAFCRWCVPMACSPFSDPGVMRVSEALRGQERLDEHEAQEAA